MRVSKGGSDWPGIASAICPVGIEHAFGAGALQGPRSLSGIRIKDGMASCFE
jgi:hypothetical protein